MTTWVGRSLVSKAHADLDAIAAILGTGAGGPYVFGSDLLVHTLTVGLGHNSLSNNTAVGKQALSGITTGVANTGVGYQALGQCTDAAGNTAVGFGAMGAVMSGNGANTAVGYQSSPLMTTGTQNAALGYWSMFSTTTGSNNTAVGYQALYLNVTGDYNAALGYGALQASTSDFNVAVGAFAGYTTTGTRNTIVGYFALHAATSGDKHTVIGTSALSSNVSGGSCVALGYFAGTYELGSDAFYVNNQDRTDTAGDKAKSILYGIFAATAASQRLRINATVGIGGAATSTSPLNITGLPTSASGLATGDVWSNSGVLTIH